MENAPSYSRDEVWTEDLEKQLNDLLIIKRELEAQNAKFRTMVEKANDPIFVVQDGRVKYANPRALAMASVTPEQLGKMHYTELLHPEERATVVARHEKRLRGEEFPSVYPIRIKNRLGEVVWAELNSAMIEWEDKPATLNVIRDITSQKLYEEHAFQTESLETLKTLSGGLAHAFNNLLMGIQGRVSLLNNLLQSQPECCEHLQGIELCIDEAARLTRQMVGFAQGGKYQVTQVDLNEVVADVIKTFQRTHKQINLKTICTTGLWPVKADRRQMELAVMNILLNAWQAIPFEGRVTIKTENFMLSPARRQNQDIPTGKSVKLAIRDTGVGMGPMVRQRVFEPFFTTKEMAKHRGLGLSSVYGIVANHNGLIDIESAKGAGTTVTVFLPAA